MKTSSKNKGEIMMDFEANEMDEILHRWLALGVSPAEKESFEKTLMFNKRFREHFCEWIKAIREPAWAFNHQKKKEDPNDGKS